MYYRVQAKRGAQEQWRRVLSGEEEREEAINSFHKGLQGCFASQGFISKQYFVVILSLGSHLGRDKTYDKLRRRFWWPKMQKDVRNAIQRCDECQRHNTLTKQPRPPMTPIKVTKPDPWRMVMTKMGDMII